MKIELSKIKPNQNNARKKFKGIKELAANINENGLLQRILIRPVKDSFEIVCGERRFKALKLLRRDKIECEIRTLTDKEAQDISLAENVQREDLSPVELAKEFQRQLKDMTQQKLADKIGKSQSYIQKFLKFLELPKLAASFLDIGIINLDHAREILRFQKLLRKIGLSSEEIEATLTCAADIIIDQTVDSKLFSKWVDCQVWDKIIEMTNKNTEKDKSQLEMIEWVLKKNIEWCSHEWTNKDGMERVGEYCEKCGVSRTGRLKR